MQTRREMLANALAAAGLAAIPIQVHEIDGSELMVVIRHPKHISDLCHRRLLQSIEHTFQGTKLEGVKCVILEEGMELEIVRKPKDV